MKPLLQVTNAEEQKREMEEEIKRLNDRHDKLKFELEDKSKKIDQVSFREKERGGGGEGGRGRGRGRERGGGLKLSSIFS